MCFSPEMDLAAGVVITAVGIDTLRNVRTRDQVALASLPLVFGVHQLIETLVWWNLQGHVSDQVGDPAAWVYLVIALGLVPVLVPYAFLRLGLVRSRNLARLFFLAGLGAAVVDLAALGVGDVARRIDGHHIAYSPGVPYDEVVLAAYVVATCAPAIFARAAQLRWFGLGNLVVVALLAWLDQNAVVSLWCVWAAMTSILINLYVRDPERSDSSIAARSTEVSS
ncbi:DUF6629 family protein [Nocardioides stalactiti]|uniref:DUF6629 family protein n=1 Tax=Nocardioides stalactiti TaxID=2755356 RepID=UPI001601F16B|nr:DUF6629 family protein [Nocardioides stalactiti]